MKVFAIVAAVAVGLYYLVFKTANGKTFVNSAAAKMGIGSSTNPLIV
ncbi:hypothetical protein [Mucilaginibacter sp. MD40]|nr:hypothetical protein [Mucilaginibacter sp. MD40]